MSHENLDHRSYLAARSNLVAEDRALRRDTARVKMSTEIELKADEIVREIRKHEAESIWAVEHEGVPNTFPGMEFLSGASNTLD